MRLPLGGQFGQPAVSLLKLLIEQGSRRVLDGFPILPLGVKGSLICNQGDTLVLQFLAETLEFPLPLGELLHSPLALRLPGLAARGVFLLLAAKFLATSGIVPTGRSDRR